MGDSDFQEDMEKLDSSFPDVADTPPLPETVRTAREWDDAARAMQSLNIKTDIPPGEPGLSEAEFEARFENAQAATSEYKKDDPQ